MPHWTWKRGQGAISIPEVTSCSRWPYRIPTALAISYAKCIIGVHFSKIIDPIIIVMDCWFLALRSVGKIVYQHVFSEHTQIRFVWERGLLSVLNDPILHSVYPFGRLICFIQALSCDFLEGLLPLKSGFLYRQLLLIHWVNGPLIYSGGHHTKRNYLSGVRK